MPRRILIIDDEQGIRAALGQLLEVEGYEVRSVGNAVDGISEYAKQRPDLVFLDVKMAGIDGVEVFHPEVSESARDNYTNVARFRGKMLTGGSDDHGTVKEKETLGTIRVPENLLGPILERL